MGLEEIIENNYYNFLKINMSLTLLGVSNVASDGVVTYYILMEDGSILLAETGDKLRQEDGTPESYHILMEDGFVLLAETGASLTEENHVPPTLTYAKWNSADKAAGVSLLDGDLTVVRTSGSPSGIRATISKTSGRHYFEIKCNSTSGVFDVWIGLANSTASLSVLPGQVDANGWAIALDGGDFYHNVLIGFASGSWGAKVNDIFGIAWNADASTMLVYRNNVLLTPIPLFSTLTGTLFPILTTQSDNTILTANFGASTMTYTAPLGYNQGLYN